ncbi:hypothetical protein [Brucella anthropi]|uniref:hypothetical protein n=1 Tax=Brucella anthropi TaxID=529 RepID=UPI000F65BC32|nr:hypothetical protein [Brucella anthropi]RRY08869.1 hypothetical protein EGJ58_13305 [Brucella anthropi]
MQKSECLHCRLLQTVNEFAEEFGSEEQPLSLSEILTDVAIFAVDLICMTVSEPEHRSAASNDLMLRYAHTLHHRLNNSDASDGEDTPPPSAVRH